MMGRRFFLALFTLSAFFCLLQSWAYGSPTNSVTNPLSLKHRRLIQNPEPGKSMADPPSEKEKPTSAGRADDDEGESPEEAPAERESRKTGKHYWWDKPVAGGGVILVCLVTAIFAAVYCYIRVTRRRHNETLK